MAPRAPVLVLPGLATSDLSTQLIRSSLIGRGHWTHGWGLGRNRGPSEATAEAVAARLDELYDRHGRPVALVGWSLGGWFAHRLARATPEKVHCVISLGSPLTRQDRRARPLPVPTTSVFSKRDVIVPWRSSLVDGDADRHENIEVRSTHLTLGLDPAVLHVIGDRVRRDPARWRPFSPPLLLSPAFPKPHPSAAGSTAGR